MYFVLVCLVEGRVMQMRIIVIIVLRHKHVNNSNALSFFVSSQFAIFLFPMKTHIKMDLYFILHISAHIHLHHIPISFVRHLMSVFRIPAVYFHCCLTQLTVFALNDYNQTLCIQLRMLHWSVCTQISFRQSRHKIAEQSQLESCPLSCAHLFCIA